MEKIYLPLQKKTENQARLPSKETVRTILAYSKALKAIKFSSGKKVLVNLN